MTGRNDQEPRGASAPAQRPAAVPQISWGLVGLAAAVLVVAVAVIENAILRTGLALAALLWAVYLSQSGREEEVESPVFRKLHSETSGLDRRKYGRLRIHTDRFLDDVRAINRLAIDARLGKMTPRHASAEMDRMVEQMGGAVDEIRKSAGIPTPVSDIRH